MGKRIKKLIALLLVAGMSVSGIVTADITGYAAGDISEEEAMTEGTDIEVGSAGEQEETEVEETEVEETEVENDASAESQVSETEVDESGAKENSWRYQDGVPIIDRTMDDAVSNAWEKVNGRYVNSRGEIIPGAEKKGIDVSEHQGKIDWEKVKVSGIEFVIIRCGYGMDEESQDDEYWEYNVSECERLGIPYGVYLYSYATNTDRAASEAQHILRLLKGHTPTYPVYIDMEDDTTISAGAATLGDIAKTFCDTISAAGYRTGVYANLNWWKNYLTSSVFNNTAWSKWVAQYNYKCDYSGKYDIWQCTNTGKVDGIDGNVDLDFLMLETSDAEPIDVEDPNIITYTTHMQTYGWMAEVSNGYQSGVTGYSKRMEAIQIKVGSGYGDLGVEYSANVQEDDWQDYVSNGETAGTQGEAKYMQAIKIRLSGTRAEDYDIYYRVYSQNFGWLGWAKNGEAAGTQGYDTRMEAIQIAVVRKGTDAPGSTDNAFCQKPISVHYMTYVNGKGWQTAVENGATSGTTGQSRLAEAFKVTLEDADYAGGVKYNAYMQSYGWTGEVKNGTEAGKPGSGKRLEAVKMSLTGELADHYDIYYRAYVQTWGWLDWAKNGETAGTIDYAKRLEALEIVLVKKGGAAPGETDAPLKQALLSYTTHVQTYGWQSAIRDGAPSGTTGQSKRMEAIKISMMDSKYQSSLRYKVHVQTYGWMDWVKGGNIAGTTGKSKRMEAIQIELTGDLAQQYDVYYRVHAQTYGWLDWAKNGESAGTEGLAKRLEAIEIVLVEKGGAAPGGTTRPFVKK